MKRNFKSFFLALFFLTFLSSFLYAEQAVVTYVRGKVEVQRADGNWYKLSVGDSISESEIITTGFSSEAKIEYNDSIMCLGAVTRCTLEKFSSSYEKDDVSVYLNVGAVRSKVNHSKDKRVSYVVKTPVAVASVRGTDFTVSANGTLTCNEGAVVIYQNIDRPNASNKKETNKNNEEVEEEESEYENSDSEMGYEDYAPATSITPANEIAKDAPAGAIVVGKNQTVSFTNLGIPETPISNATKKTQQAKTVVVTAADKEIEIAGSYVPNITINDKITAQEIENLSINNSNLLVELELND